MKKWTNELVQIAWEDGQKVAMLHQNGSIEIYKLKPASKADVAEILESEQQEHA